MALRQDIKPKFETNDVPSQEDFYEVFDSFVHKDEDKATIDMIDAGVDDEHYITPALLRVGLQNAGVISGGSNLPFKQYENNFNDSFIHLEWPPIESSVKVFKNGQLLLEGEDYTINYETAVVTFPDLVGFRNIEIDYWYKSTEPIPGNGTNYVDLTTNQTVGGEKTFEKVVIKSKAFTETPFYYEDFATGFGDFVNSSDSDVPWVWVTDDGADGSSSCISSGAIGDMKNSIIELSPTTTHESTLLKYWYKTSSELNFDYLFVEVNGVTVKKYSGTNDWTEDHVFIHGIGEQLIKFSYRKDQGAVEGQDKVWIDKISLTNAEEEGFAFAVNGNSKLEGITISGTSTAVSAQSISALITPTLIATNDRDTLIGVKINPNFITNGFNSDNHIALSVSGYSSFDSISGQNFQLQRAGNGNTVIGLNTYYNPISDGLDFNLKGVNSSITIAKAGNVLIETTDNEIDRLQVGGSILATAIKISGGTSSEFLKADGSVDSSTYATLASPTFTGTVILPNTTSIGSVSNTELSYVDGVTSSIQTQLDGKANNSGVLHNTGNESFTGVKSATNTGSTQINGISLTNNGAGSSSSILVSNTSSGYGIYSTNSTGTGIYSTNSTGKGIYSYNTSSGQGIYSDNLASGRGIYSTNNSTGTGVYSDNYSTGKGIYSNNASSGYGIVSNTTTAGTGLNYVGQNNGTNTFTVAKTGVTTASSFIKSGGISSQFLKADGSVDTNAYLPLTGGTISGSLTSTTFVKSGSTSDDILLGDGTTTSLAGIAAGGSAVPVSATVSGIVDNTSLQELGGVDKLINGVRIGQGKTPGQETTAVGFEVLLNDTGGYNTAVGYQVLKANTTGYANDGFGDGALLANTTGTYNSAFGAGSLLANTTGTQNIGIGGYALYTNTTGTRNTAVGLSALQQNNGSFNTAIGNHAGSSFPATVTTGNSNITIGFQAGRDITTGNNNLLIENITNASITTGNNNIVLNPIQKSGITTGSNNLILGGYDGYFAENTSNTIALGTGAGVTRFLSDSNGLNTIPTQTNALITGDSTGKAVVTKEYMNAITKPYKVYVALLTQGGTNAPTVIVLENTLGGSIVWSYTATGVYYGTLTGAFTSDKTTVLNNITNGNVHVTAIRASSDLIQIQTRDLSSTNVNNAMNGMTLEIRVYN